MKIHLEYFSQVRTITETDEETLHVSDNSTVGEVLELLADRFGSAFSDLIFPEGKLARSILLAANDTAITDTYVKLAHGDRISILTPMSGG